MSSVIETERLTLRPIEPTDAALIFDLLSRDEIARWVGDGRAMTDPSEADAWIARRPDRAGDHPAAGTFVVSPRGGAPVGITILCTLPPSAGRAERVHEIGWHLLPSAWGYGYATEAGAAMTDRAFEPPEGPAMDAVWAVTKPDNAPSQAVCRRLGMTDLGLTTDWYDRELRTFRLDRG